MKEKRCKKGGRWERKSRKAFLKKYKIRLGEEGRDRTGGRRRDEVSKGVMSNGEESDDALQMTHHIPTQRVDGGLNNIMR